MCGMQLINHNDADNVDKRKGRCNVANSDALHADDVGDNDEYDDCVAVTRLVPARMQRSVVRI